MRIKDYCILLIVSLLQLRERERESSIICCISGYMFFVEYGVGSFNWTPYFIHIWSQVQSFKIYLTEEKASLIMLGNHQFLKKLILCLFF